MKKFYETPAVEFTGFSAEDVITTSVITIDTTEAGLNVADFTAAVQTQYAGATTEVANYGSYNW